ncbi:MAG: right-handed parallel beta-helix repeat-containing protein [Verrucomicrobiota bacterium]
MLDRPRIAAICARTGMLFAWAALAQGSDFYVAEQGDDASSGESPRLAWRSIERVNRHRFQPGDRLLFESGQTFHGNLYLSATNAAPDGTLVVTTAGDAPARILAGDGTGVRVHNLAGITNKNLLIEGSGRTNNTGYGIWCENRLATGERLQHLRVEQVEVSGFGIFGILITGTKAGFEHVVVTQSTMRDNLRGGMEIAGQLPYDSPSYAHQDVQVTHCRAYSNTGDPTYLKNHSGSGIVLYQVDGGLIDHCVAWNNGALCRSSGGGVGLWACASRGVTIQHCESFANRTSGADGGGFDLDGGSVECVLQFNYSHDNDGPGLMIYSYPAPPIATTATSSGSALSEMTPARAAAMPACGCKRMGRKSPDWKSITIRSTPVEQLIRRLTFALRASPLNCETTSSGARMARSRCRSIDRPKATSGSNKIFTGRQMPRCRFAGDRAIMRR